MIITTVTDEVARQVSLEKAVEIAGAYGITHFEIRNVEGKRFPLLDAGTLQKLKRCRQEYGITYTCVSPGIFKVPLRSEEFAFHRGELLQRTMNMAEELEIRRMIIFGIMRSPDDRPGDYEQVVEELGKTALEAQKRGFTVLVENEPGWWADTSDNCLNIFRDINLPSLQLNWDPGNLFSAGEHDYKPGYEKLKDYIGNVHVKDVVCEEGKTRYVALGEGEIDYKGQISDLLKDGYKGNITIETHCKQLQENFEKSARYLKSLLQA